MGSKGEKKRDSLIQTRDLELKVAIEDFCARTNRDMPDTLRVILGMFFADGHAVAEARLTAQLWSADDHGASEVELMARIESGARAAKKDLARSRRRRPGA